MAKQKKQFTELSDEELEKVTGGGMTPIARTCDELFTNPCGPGMWKNPNNNCQCVPMPNADLGAR